MKRENINKFINKIKFPKKGKSHILFAIIVCVFLYAISIRINAKSWGTTVGNSLGSKVGSFSGSYGAWQDSKKAYAEGRAEGLSAEDTTVSIENRLKDLNKLEVLVASVKLKDIQKIGKKDEEDYAALYLLKGEIVFTVDLSIAQVEDNEGEILVTLPMPEGEIKFDDSLTEEKAEYQKHGWTGDNEAGFDAYINSMKKTSINAEDEIANYDALMLTAKNAAEKQVEQLAGSVSVNNKNVTVEFQEEQ